MLINDHISAGMALILGFILPWLQTRRLAGSGSDHPVHVFLVSSIRRNGHRLFSRVPRIVNPSYCGAFPLYLHWVLSFFGPRAIVLAAKYLNPIVNFALITLIYVTLREMNVLGYYDGPAGLVALVCALTPQFLHAFSARNFGLSSRPLGLFFVTALLFVHALRLHESAVALIILETSLVFMILAFNTFALQFLILFSPIYLAISRDFGLLAPLLLGLLIFIAVHPRYSLGYLKHTILFVRAYQKELAKIFILPRRPSIWRDLVIDIPAKLAKSSLGDVIKYAYGNSVLILVFLNPVLILSVISYDHPFVSTFVDYSKLCTLIALGLFVITSFRITRFLGEPERYIEMVTPLSCIVGVQFLIDTGSGSLIGLFLAWYVVANAVQLVIALKLHRHLQGTQRELQELGTAINVLAEGEVVVFSSNSEDVIKNMMAEPWKFVRYWSFETRMAGLGVSDVFSVYPNLRMEAFCRIAAAYGVNTAIVDKSLGEALPAYHLSTGLKSELLRETDRYAAFRLAVLPQKS